MMRNSWPPLARLLVILASLFALAWLATRIMPLLQVLVIAGLLAYLIRPLATTLEQRSRLGYAASVRVVFFSSLIILTGLLAALGTVAWSQVGNQVYVQFEPLWQEILKWLSQPIQIFNFTLLPADWIKQALPALVSGVGQLSVRSVTWLTDLTHNILMMLLVFISTYYIMLDSPGFVPWLIGLLPKGEQHDVRILLERIDEVWRVFLRAQILIFLILAGLMALGTFGVFMLFYSGLLNFSWLLLIILLVVVYSAVQQVDNLWLRPLWMGRELSLHPGVVFAGLVAALLAGGLLAAFLIVPVIATARILLRYLHRRLFDLDPWPEETYRWSTMGTGGPRQQEPET